jgi:hypothetical protein
MSLLPRPVVPDLDPDPALFPPCTPTVE